MVGTVVLGLGGFIVTSLAIVVDELAKLERCGCSRPDTIEGQPIRSLQSDLTHFRPRSATARVGTVTCGWSADTYSTCEEKDALLLEGRRPAPRSLGGRLPFWRATWRALWVEINVEGHPKLGRIGVRLERCQYSM